MVFSSMSAWEEGVLHSCHDLFPYRVVNRTGGIFTEVQHSIAVPSVETRVLPVEAIREVGTILDNDDELLIDTQKRGEPRRFVLRVCLDGHRGIATPMQARP